MKVVAQHHNSLVYNSWLVGHHVARSVLNLIREGKLVGAVVQESGSMRLGIPRSMRAQYSSLKIRTR